MNAIKNFLFRILSLRQYLRVISGMFFLSFRSGRLEKDRDYDCHYFARRTVQPGDYVLDIGANLGYYTALFARKVGSDGRVYAVEPVPLFREVLQANTGHFSNIEIIPFALGNENGKTVTMGVPAGHKYFRHGMTHVSDADDSGAHSHTFQAKVRRGSELFANLPRLDYIKTDVEGYEIYILPELQPVIEQHRPIIQVELGHKTRAQLRTYLEGLDYEAHFVKGKELIPLAGKEGEAYGDLIFLPR